VGIAAPDRQATLERLLQQGNRPAAGLRLAEEVVDLLVRVVEASDRSRDRRRIQPDRQAGAGLGRSKAPGRKVTISEMATIAATMAGANPRTSPPNEIPRRGVGWAAIRRRTFCPRLESTGTIGIDRITCAIFINPRRSAVHCSHDTRWQSTS